VHGALPEHGGNLLIVANHISWLDIFVLNALVPVRFIAKVELARWPVAGRMVRDVGTLFIERERRRDTLRVNRQAAQVLEQGDIIAIFAEGTTTYGDELLPFKSSLLQPIVDARGQVQPVALRYRAHDDAPSALPAYVGDDPFIASFWRVCGAHRLRVEVHVLDRLHAEGRHRRELAREAEAAVRAALGLSARGMEPGRSGDQAGAPP